MGRSLAILLLSSIAASCAGPSPAPRVEDPFLAAVEYVQMKGGGGKGFSLIATQEKEGKIDVYKFGLEPGDRFIYLWGEDGPLAPVFFSMGDATRFSILEASALSERKLSEKEAQEWAWKKLQELPELLKAAR